MAEISFPKTELEKYGLPDRGFKGVKLISDEITDKSRWSVSHEIIFQWIDGKFYSTYYSEGATECQDESPWEYEDDIECMEVEPVKTLIDVYLPVDREVTSPVIDYPALVTAAQDFVAKVDIGAAHSVSSYAAFKSALGIEVAS